MQKTNTTQYFNPQTKGAFLRNIGFVLFILFCYSGALAQSFRTVTFSGSSSDFNAAEKYTAQGTAQNTDYYVTFDATNLYIGAFRTGGSTFGGSDNFAIYIDTDPASPATGGTGTSAGQSYNGVSGTLPFTANYNVHAEQSYQEARSFGSTWASTITGVTYWTNTTAREVKIPLSSIGSPDALYLTMWMGYTNGFFANAPGTNITAATNPTITGYIGGFGVTSADCVPINTINTAITASITNGVPVAGAVYGKVTVNTGTVTNANAWTLAPGGSIQVTGGTFAFGTQTITMGSATTSNGKGTTINTSGTGAITTTASSVFDFGGEAVVTGNNLSISGSIRIRNKFIGIASGGLTIASGGNLDIRNGGYVSSNPPTYASGSTLMYNSGTNYGVSTEWTAGATSGAGYPSNVTISNNIASSGLNFGSSNTAYSMGGSMNIGFTLTSSILALSTGTGNLNIGGDWTKNASATFTTNSKTVTFNGTAAQAINSATTFYGLTIANTTANVTAAAAITMGAGGLLTINSNARLDMAANTLTLTSATSSINGFLRSAGAITGASTTTMTVNNGGTYEHNYTTTAGTFPTATWNTGSTMAVIGYTSAVTIGASITQTYSNFTWNCTNQGTQNINLLGQLITVNGNFSILSTGTTGSLVYNSNSPVAPTLTIGGNFTMSGNAFNLNNGTSTPTFNIAGNFSQTTGTITKVGAGTTTINFNKASGTQTFSQSGGSITATANWNVGTGSSTNTVQMTSNINLGTGTGAFSVLSGSAMDFQTFVLSGSGSFVPATGSTLISANTSATGAFQTSTANGSVQTTTRTFTAAGVSYTYNGASVATGNAIASATNTNIKNLTINSSSNVALTSAALLSSTGVLTFTAGSLDIGANDLTLTSGATVSGAGTGKYVKTSSTGQLKRTALTTAFTFPVGNSAYNPITLTNTGTSDTYGIIALDGTVPNALDATKAVNRYWAVTEGTTGGGNLAVTAQFNTADGAGAGYTTATNPQFIGLYPNASPWTQVSSGAAAVGSNPYTVSASGYTTSLPTSGSTYYFAVGISGAFNVPAPTISAIGGVVVSAPGSGTSGYVGNTITINGTGLGSVTVVKVGGSAGTTVTILSQSSTTLTFAAINLGGTIYVENPGGNATSSETYTNLGYITTATGGWNTAGTWLGGSVPPSATNTDVTIAHNVTSTSGSTDVGKLTVNASTTLTITAATIVNVNTASTNSGTITNNGTLSTAATYTNSGTITMNGAFQINTGGWATGTNFVYGASGTLNFNASSAYTVSNTDVFWPTSSGPFNVSVLQGGLTLSSASRTIAGTFATAAGVTQTSSTLTISGTNQLNSGGFFNSAPTYSGSATLIYNNTGTYAISNEWTGNATTAGSGIPFNVTIQNSTTLTFPTTNRGIGGAFNVSSGGATLNATSGDLYVGGNFTNNGTFTHNTRALFLNGTTQTLGGTNINGSGTTNCFPYLILQNATNVTLAASAAVTNTLTLTSGKITLSTFDLNMGASAIASATSTNYIVTNSTGQLKRTVTTSAVLFPVGNSAYNPITFTNAGTSDTYGIRVADGAPANANDALVTVQRSWYITEATAGGSDLTPVVAQYNSGDVGSNFNAGSSSYMGLYNATSWTQVATTLGGSITATSSGTNQFPATIPAGSYIAIGKDVGLTTTPPTITSFTTSGYSGSSVVISGSNFLGATAVTFGGTAATSFTVDNAGQITAVVGTGGTSGSVSVTTPSGSTSLAGFTYLGFITTSGASTWNTGASWLGGVVPTANTTTTIAHNLSISAAFTNSPVESITVNTGITATASSTVAIGTVTNAITTVGTGAFTFTGAAGSITAGSFVNGGTLSWTAASTLNISAGGTLTNNGTFTRGTGTVNFVGSAGTINGSNAITFNNLTSNSGGLTLTTVPTIDGTLQLNGGFVSAAPIYTSNSTLYYNLSYSRSSEWSATGVGTIGTTAGYPNNVTINTGTFDIVNGSNTARSMNGSLTINTGATFNVNALNAAITIGGGLTTNGTGAFSMGTSNASLTVTGAVNNAGSLSLSSTLGGDIYVAGNFTNNGSFTHNTRAVFLNGTSQTVSGSALNTSGATNCFDYLIIQNGTNATLGSSLAVRTNVTFTSGKITLGANDLNLGTATITTPTSSSYVVTNSSGQLKRTVAASNVLFPVGNAAYNPLTLNNSGTSDTYGVIEVDGALSTANAPTYSINRRWQVTEAVSGNSNLAVIAQNNTGEENTNYTSGTTDFLGFYNGSSWSQQAATRSGSNPFTVSSNSNFNLTAANLTSGTQYFAIGRDAAFLPLAPTVTSLNASSGYSGSTIIITGTDFTGTTAVSFGGTAAASFTVNSATQITAVVGTGGATGNVSVTTPSGTSSLAGFTYLGFITTTGASNWNTAASWLGGAVPTANNAVTIAHNLIIAAAFTNSPITSITVNTGITATASSTVAIGTVTNAITTVGTGVFTFTGASGSIIAGSFVNGGTLSWTAAATLNISASGTLTNNGTFTSGTGTVVFANAGTVNGSGAITFNNLTLTAGVLSLSTTPTIAGTFALNGGNISTNAPIYTNTSTLQYGATYSRFLEWSATGVGTLGTTQGYPNNVTISAGTFTVVNSDAGTARALAGNVQVNTGCTFTTGALNAVLTIGGNLTTTGTGNFNISSSNAAVTIIGSVSNAGTLALSSTVGGDLNVAGNWTNSGTFTHNSRAVAFNGTAAQAINSATTFGYLSIINSSADVTAAAAITVINNLTINGSASLTRLNMQTNTLTLTGATSTITSGFLRSAGTITGGTNTFGANGTYEHNFTTTFGTIPTATWSAGSTCAIIGLTSPAAGSWIGASANQSFSNFTWNCTSQSTAPNMGGATITATGTFTMASTGTSELRLGGATSGSITCANFTQTGGTINCASGTGSGSINVSGTFNQSAGTINESAGGSGTINLNATSGNQNVTQSGSITNTVNWNVGNGSSTNTATLLTGISTAGTFSVLAGSSLDFGTNVVSGTGTFTAATGSTLITANTNATGALMTSGANGSVQTTTRTFTNSGVNYTFNGSAAQNTGTAIGAAANIGTLNLSNTSGANPAVTFGASTTVATALNINNGINQLGAFNITVTPTTAASISGGSSTAYIQTNSTGRLFRGIATTGLPINYNFPVGSSGNYTPASFNFSANASAFNLGVNTVAGSHPSMNSNSTQTDYITNRYWTTNVSGGPTTTYTYTSVFNYLAGDVAGTVANIKLDRWNGSVWTEDAGSSATTTSVSSGSLNATSGSLTATAEWTGRVNPAVINYTWNGSTDNSWSTLTNWTPNGVPTSVDNAIINVPGTNTLIIIDAQTISDFTVSGTGTFQLTSTGSLSVNGNISNSISGSPTFDCASTFTIANTGNQTIPSWNFGNLNASGGSRVLSSTGTIGICGTFTPGAGAYTNTGSTVNFNGTGAQTVNAFNYNNLTISGAHTTNNITLPAGTIGISGTFSPTATFSTGAYSNTGNTIDYNGTGAQTVAAFSSYNNLTISGARASATVTLASGTIGVAGSFNPSATVVTYTSTGNTFDYTSAGSQTIAVFSQYNNLSNSGNGVRTLANGIIAVYGTYTPTSAVITVGTSTVDFAGTAGQTIPASFYYNITNSSNTNRTWANAGIIDIKNAFTPTSAINTITGSTIQYSATSGTLNLTTFTTNVASRNYNNLIFNGTGGTWTLNANNIGVANDLTVSAGSLILGVAAGAGTLNVDGNLTVSGGTLNTTNTTTAGTINLIGNLTVSSGTFTKGGSGVGSVNLIKSTGTQIFSQSGGTISNANAWNFGNGTTANTIQIASNVSASTGVFNVNTGTTVDFGTNVLTVSTGSFLLNSGASLITANVNGISTATANTGSVNKTGAGTITFSAAANYTYNGVASQITGPGFTGSNNLTLNNSAGLTLTAAASVNGALTFTSGLIDISAVNLTIGASGSIAGANTAKYVKTSGVGQLKMTVAASNVLFPVGRSAYNPLALNNSGTSDVFGVVLTDAISQALNNSSLVVNRSWNITETDAGGSNLSIVSQWNGAGEQAAGFAGGTTPRIAYWNGSAWVQTGASQAGANPYTFSSSANLSGIASATYSIAIGKDDAFNCTAAPTITSFSAPSGYAGDVITINGTGLTGLTGVTIGGTAAILNSQSGTSASITVQGGTTGLISVSTSPVCSASSSINFTFLGFVSAQTGNWGTSSTWVGNSVPSSGADVLIASTHNVTTNVVATPSSVTIQNGATLTLSNAADFGDASLNVIVNGTLICPSTVTNPLNGISANSIVINNGGVFTNSAGNSDAIASNSFTVSSGGTYNHDAISSSTNGNTFDLPGGTSNNSFDANGNINITKWGQTGNTPTAPFPLSLTSTYGNLTINITSQTYTGAWNLQGGVVGTTNFTINATGSREMRMFTNGVGGTMNVAGNLLITGGIVAFQNASSSGTANATMNIAGDMTVSGGSFDLTGTGAGTSGSSVINLSGNLTVSGAGAIIRTTANTLPGIATFRFNKSSGVQTINVVSGALSTNAIAWQVGNGTTTPELQMLSDVVLNAASRLTVNNLATLNCGVQVLRGTTAGSNGAFTLANGGTLKIGSADGISAAPAITGNIQTGALPADRLFNSSGNYTYSGSVNQVTGNGLPSTITGTLSIANTGSTSNNTVTLSTTGTTTSTFNLTSGLFAAGSAGQLNISASGTVNGTGGDFVTGTNAGILNFPSTGTFTGTSNPYNVYVSGGVNFGSGTVTIQPAGTFRINTGGFVSSNAPFYASGSTLQYYTTGVYGRNLEWRASSGRGYPHHVQVSNSTTLNPGANSNTGQPFNTGGNLTIDAGSNIYMDYGALNMTVPLSVIGGLNLNGNLSLSGVIGGDINVGGDWINNGTTSNFITNNRAVNFNGSINQNIGGTNTSSNPFAYVTINNPSGVTLTYGQEINKQLSFSNGTLTLGNFDLFMNGLNLPITGYDNSKFIVTNGSGNLYRNFNNVSTVYPVGPSSISYNPLTLNQAGTPDYIGVRVATTPSYSNSINDNNQMVLFEYFLSEVTPGENNLTTSFQWNSTNEGSTFNRSGGVYQGNWNGLQWVVRPSLPTSGSNPYTSTSTVNYTGNLINTSMIVGNINGIFSCISTSSNGSWNDSNIWQSGIVPPADASVCINHPITLAGTDVNIANVTINTSGSLTVDPNINLNIADLGGIVNNSGATTSLGQGNVIFTGIGSVTGLNPVTIKNLTLNGNTTLTATTTIDGNLTINSGAYIIAGSPTYSATSTLIYATGGNYTSSNEWNANASIAGLGTPQNVLINGTNLSLASGNRGLLGDLTISSGALSLNSSSGDLYVGGNWNRNSTATFNSNNRAVIFTGATNQTITTNGGGNETFAYLIANKTAGNLVLNNSPATNVIVGASTGNVLEIASGNTIDLNGQSLSLTGTGGNINLPSGIASITGSSGSVFSISNGSKTVTPSGGATLEFGPNVTVALNNGINFGANTSTINGTLQLANGGFVSTNAPTYAAGSTLRYFTGNSFNRGLEWSTNSGPGYPHHVVVDLNSTVTTVNLAPGSSTCQLAGNLTLNNGAILNMGAMTNPLVVLGDVNIGGSSSGTLSLSTAAGGDIKIGGNLTRNAGGTLTQNGREVEMNGSITQNISGVPIFSYLAINNSAASVKINDNTSINNRLRLSNGVFDLNSLGCTLANGSKIVRINGTMSASPTVLGTNIYDLEYQNSVISSVEYLASSTAVRDLIITSGNTLTLGDNCTFNRDLTLSGGDLNLGGYTLTARGRTTAPSFSGSITVSGGGVRSITGPAGSIFDITGLGANLPNDYTKTVSSFSGSTLSFDSNVLVRIGDGAVDFGVGSPTTINGTLQVMLGGSVGQVLNPCYYGVNSLLRFSNTVDYQVGSNDKTWASGSISSGNPGIPYNVEVMDANTDLQLQSTRALLGNLTITDGTFTLTPAYTGSFNIGGNWSRSGATSAFNHNSKKVVFDRQTAGNQTLTVSSGVSSETFYDLEVSLLNGNLVSSSSSALTINNNLNFVSGKIDLGANRLTIGTSLINGTITGASSSNYVITNAIAGGGNIKAFTNSNATYNFPVGDATNYSPMSVTLTNGAQVGSYITTTTVQGAHPNMLTGTPPTKYISRYWSVEPTGLAINPVYNVSYSYVAADEVGTGTLYPVKYSTSTTTPGWLSCPGSTASAVTGTSGANDNVLKTFTWNGLTTFSDFSGAGDGSPLPVTWLNFDAQFNNATNNVDVTWTTASEINNDYFEILRSNDAVNFNVIGTVDGAGNSSLVKEYAFEDTNPLEGISYYKVRQVDFNGIGDYTEIRAVSNLGGIATGTLFAYPNPLIGQDLTIVYSNLDKGNWEYRLFDITGKIVLSQNRNSDLNAGKFTLNLEQLPAGVYLFQLNTQSQNFTRKITISK